MTRQLKKPHRTELSLIRRVVENVDVLAFNMLNVVLLHPLLKTLFEWHIPVWIALIYYTKWRGDEANSLRRVRYVLLAYRTENLVAEYEREESGTNIVVLALCIIEETPNQMTPPRSTSSLCVLPLKPPWPVVCVPKDEDGGKHIVHQNRLQALAVSTRSKTAK